MESGLEDRNNAAPQPCCIQHFEVSMESGLEDRNNRARGWQVLPGGVQVSMESGLEDRNNQAARAAEEAAQKVSMESGLEDRNNTAPIVAIR